MKIIKPIAILDAMLDSSNVAETSPAANEWDTSAMVVDELVTITYTGAGAAVATHLVYKCTVAHTNKDPSIAANLADYWVVSDATNRWRAFNNVLQQAVSNADTIEYELTTGAIVTAAAFFGIDAQSVQITMTDPTDGVVYDETFSTISPSGITDWYAYFTEEIIRLNRLYVPDLPAFPLATLDIVLDDTGATPVLGEVVLGAAFSVGDSQNGASFGIVDYSVKNTDDEGNITITPGAYADIADVTVIIQTSRFDHISSTLKSYKSEPLVWIASEDYAETMIFGYFRNFRNIISGPSVSTTLLQLEGLT